MKYYIGVHEYGEGHDAGVCAVDETGRIVTMLEAERFTKIKKLNPVVPDILMRAVFKYVDPSDVVGLGIGQINHVYDSFQNRVRTDHGRIDLDEITGRRHADALYNFARVFRLADYFPNLQKVVEIRHHLAHLYSAYYPSPYDEALIISVDGNGDFPEAVVVGHGKGNDCKMLWSAGSMTSLGALYRTAGMKYSGLISPEGEGKIMGLASYGRPIFAEQLHNHLVRFDPNRMTLDFDEMFGIVDKDDVILQRLEEKFGPAGNWPDYDPSRDLPQIYKDMAASVQKVVEDYLLHLVRVWVEKTGCRNLCMAGGVAMNSMANGEIMRSGLIDNLFIQPASSDNGLCLGAAYGLLQSEQPRWREHPKRFILRHTYYGSSATDREIEETLNHFGLPAKKVADPSAWAAERLAQGKIIGWFQGRMEFGARALGNRSILADPRSEGTKDVVNLKVKDREFWRPFAPAVLCEAMGEWFENDRPEPFMTVVYKARSERLAKIPAVIHVDGTARVQSVSREDNPSYYDVISKFRDLTGIPVILNTSMNGKGEPIARVPAEAVKLFLSSDLDALVIGNYVLDSKPAEKIAAYQLRCQSLLWEINGGNSFQAILLETSREFPEAKLDQLKTAIDREGGKLLPEQMSSENIDHAVVFVLGNYNDDGVRDLLVPKTVHELVGRYPECRITIIELFGDSIHMRLTSPDELSWPLRVNGSDFKVAAVKDRMFIQGRDYSFKKVSEYRGDHSLAIWPLGGTANMLLNGDANDQAVPVLKQLKYFVDKHKCRQKTLNGYRILSPHEFQMILVDPKEDLDLIIATETYTAEILQQVVSFSDRINIYLLKRNMRLYRLLQP